MWKTSSKRRLPVQTLNHIDLQRGLVYKNTYTELSICLKNLEDFCVKWKAFPIVNYIISNAK